VINSKLFFKNINQFELFEDETALVKAAQKLGIVFHTREPDRIKIKFVRKSVYFSFLIYY
jgi:hypothetical protein